MQFQQRGSTLVISLILVLIVSIIGLSSVGNVSLNQKMATSYRDSDVAFQAAEAALAEGEAFAETLSVSLLEDYFDPSCGGTNCFTASCNDGKCFNGTYTAGAACALDEPSTPLAENMATWDTAGRARSSVLNLPDLSEQPKYIVEFLCYIQADPTAVAPSTPPPYAAADWAYFFRVSSYAQGASASSRIVLQSTYKVLR